jgi:hypothetical protein
MGQVPSIEKHSMKEKMIKDLPMKPAYQFGEQHSLAREVSKIRKMRVRPGWIYRGHKSSHTTRVKRGYIVELFEEKEIFDEFKKEHWPFGDTDSGKTNRRRLLHIKAEYAKFRDGV